MAEAGPELIFLAGPQRGRRCVVMTSPALAGRAASCDLHLAEQFASRRQFRLELTVEGWVMENLSANGTRVNGKRFKSGKRVLLDSGDVLGVGRDTEILFVAPGDDPEQVLSEYRSAHPVEAAPARPPGQAPPEDQPGTEQPAEQPVERTEVSEEPADQMTDEERQRKAKIRKYIIFALVWGAGLIVLLIALSMLKRTGRPAMSARPVRLSKRQIRDLLREDIERARNLQAAAERLAKAVAGYGTGKWFREGELQACVKNFKLHLAYLGRADFDDPKHSLMYKDARRQLIAMVQDRYTEAWIREQDGRWAGADEIWQRLMRIIPHDREWDTPGYKKLQKNIMAHAAYVRRHLKKR